MLNARAGPVRLCQPLPAARTLGIWALPRLTGAATAVRPTEEEPRIPVMSRAQGRVTLTDDGATGTGYTYALRPGMGAVGSLLEELHLPAVTGMPLEA
jgi:hypothetical protein